MIIQCTICSDLIISSENIYATKCGHVFHYHCLYEWIVRSKSCPQCRRRITEKCMFRIFPNTTDAVSNNEEGVATLQNKLDNANLKIIQQDIELKKVTEENSTLQARIKKNEKSLKCVKEKITATETLMNAFTEQIDFLKTENKQLKKVKHELEIVEEKLKVLQGLQVILNSTAEEVERMLEGYQDVRTVCVFATALKKALYESETKTSKLRNTLQEAKQRLSDEKKKNTECQGKLANMDEALANMTKKYEELKKKLEDQKSIGAMGAPGAYDAPASFELDDSWSLMNRTKTPSSPKYSPTETVTNKTCLNTMISNIENADSPYLNLKQSSLPWAGLQYSENNNNNNETYNNNNNNFQGIKPVKHKYPKPTATMVSGSLTGQEVDLSIFQAKDPGLPDYLIKNNNNSEPSEDVNVSYDGLGGHSSFTDMFPMPKRPFQCPNIVKPKSSVPKLSAKHKLKRPNPSGSQDIGQMLKKMRDS